jgi:hypothetical protein
VDAALKIAPVDGIVHWQELTAASNKLDVVKTPAPVAVVEIKASNPNADQSATDTTAAEKTDADEARGSDATADRSATDTFASENSDTGEGGASDATADQSATDSIAIEKSDAGETDRNCVVDDAEELCGPFEPSHQHPGLGLCS